MIFNSEISGEQQHTTSPVVTGGSVIALVYNGGVIVGTDTLCSYGSMAAFKNVQKIAQISKNTIYASSGEFSDFQQVVKELAKIDRAALQYDDGVHPSPKDYGNFLARLSYKKRCKINPLYLQNVIAGFHNGERYLSLVDIYGIGKLIATQLLEQNQTSLQLDSLVTSVKPSLVIIGMRIALLIRPNKQLENALKSYSVGIAELMMQFNWHILMQKVLTLKSQKEQKPNGTLMDSNQGLMRNYTHNEHYYYMIFIIHSSHGSATYGLVEIKLSLPVGYQSIASYQNVRNFMSLHLIKRSNLLDLQKNLSILSCE